MVEFNSEKIVLGNLLTPLPCIDTLGFYNLKNPNPELIVPIALSLGENFLSEGNVQHLPQESCGLGGVDDNLCFILEIRAEES